MYRKGHVGASLVVYAPTAFALAALTTVEFAVLGAIVVSSMAMVPDVDVRIPFVTHRGITHTVWFALIVGSGFALVGAAVGFEGGIVTTVSLAVIGFVLGAGTILSHLLADALTPMGIQPYAPLRDDHFTFDVAKAANPVANYALLVLGCVVAGAGLLAGTIIAG